MTWAEGQLLQSGRYRIIRQLGGGGFGLTYLAEDSSLRRQVVIKTPNRIFQRDQEYEKFISRFKSEGQALAKISHPNVVQVIEFFQEQGMPCLVMTYVQGETLNQLIRRREQLPEGEAVQCFRQLATALQFVHQAGLIHCDVHPGNIMLRQAGDPVLIDFGSAKTLQPSTQTVTTTLNDYAPYEQGRGGAPQPTLDIYSLAATLYFAVTGSKPESAMSRKLYGDALKEPKQHRADLSTWLNQAILKGMALEPQDRPTSMQAWLNLLQPPQMPKLTSVVPSGNAQPKQPAQIRQPSFPWIGLGYVALGYLPIGILLGWSTLSVSAGDGAMAVAVTMAGAGAVAWAGARAWAGAGAGVGAGAVAVAVAGIEVWAGTSAWAWAVAVVGPWAVAVVGAWAGRAWAWISFCLIGALLGGAISDYSIILGIWSRLGLGLLAFVQFFLILMGVRASEGFLDNCDRKSRILIIGTISILGLALGVGLGWWLNLSGAKFPF
ncbi:serine/threonine protein kinase [Leptolyngbya sp. GGD]|uniref:serine/threonine protein kinase n=1 Tax=Leptolyngbya sp. GGD TaxID=2997907 RepID=UPI00227A6859|nr:serine/threonine-protein kinase [Leptolyngbya sp. GGD]MCY6489254.1 serine/threonine-protein kinase [Leptolyngbya sp. GGD]